MRIDSATVLRQVLVSDWDRLCCRYAIYRIIIAKRPSMMSVRPITDSMSREEREALIQPFYYAQVYERFDGSKVPPPGETGCLPYLFWIDGLTGEWKNWRLRKFYSFATLQQLGIAEVISQAGGNMYHA